MEQCCRFVLSNKVPTAVEEKMLEASSERETSATYARKQVTV
jgi:hypothetical protein